MYKSWRKAVFLIPLLSFVALGLLLYQAKAERVMKEVTRSVAPLVAQPESIIKPKIKLEIDTFKKMCPNNDYCQMEKCSNFYSTVHFLKAFFENQANNTIDLGPTFVGVALMEMKCIGFPRDDAFDSGGQTANGFLINMLRDCAYNENNVIQSFSNSACNNPYQSSVKINWEFLIYYAAADVEELNALILQQTGKPNFFNPATKVPICIGDTVNLWDWGKACENLCCFD